MEDTQYPYEILTSKETGNDTAKPLDMMGKLKMEFRNDTLYRLFYDADREDELFTDDIIRLSDTHLYSTPEAALILDEKDSNLRHYIKMLEGYVRPIYDGRLIKLNYEAVFRLRMILCKVKEDYSVQKLQQMLLGAVKGGQLQKSSGPDPKVEVLEKRLDAAMNMMEQMYSTGLFKLGGTPGQPQMLLNEEVFESIVDRVLEKRMQPLIESQDKAQKIESDLQLLSESTQQSIESVKEVFEKHLRSIQESAAEREQQLTSEFNLIKQNMTQKITELETELSHRDINDINRFITETRIEKKLRAAALEEYKKLGFFSKLSRNVEEFVEEYIRTHKKYELNDNKDEI